MCVDNNRVLFAEEIYLTETADTLLWDEEENAEDDDSSFSAPPSRTPEENLRIRFLTDFYLIDPHRSSNEEHYVGLDALPVSPYDASSGRYEARGSASALCTEDEDALDAAIGDEGGEDEIGPRQQRLRTSGIMKLSVDYLEQNG